MMKLVLVAALMASALALTDEEQWSAFKAKYNKQYMMGAEPHRFSIFQSNLRLAEKLQAQDSQATYGVTKFMDLTHEEFRARFANLNVAQVKQSLLKAPVASLGTISADTMINWVKGNPDVRVGPVRDQGQCGSCWAFSATQAAEACYANATGNYIELSAQMTASCCTAGGSDCCNGGWPDQALRDMVSNQGLASESSYPYKSGGGINYPCQKSGKTLVLHPGVCSEKSLSSETNGNEAKTLAGLAQNPVSICVDATPLQVYNSGIISGSTCTRYTSIDHAILLVANDGAGSSSSSTTWIAKNSWGADWGEDGYFRMEKGVDCLKFTSLNSIAIPNN